MSDASTSSRALQCVIVTPEATVREGSAQFVAVPLFDGELGIAPLHAPMIGRLGFGELRILDGGKTERLYVDGGFVQVTGNTVYILTNRAIPAEKLEKSAVEEQLRTARTKPANTAELLAVRERQVSQARAQLRVAQRA
ncbi:MAG: ATP synthase F1 subunit epsilon [Planctomycetaceae bacterium]|nr:ATP synthase F1 subunit epsilon [Planctomycetaceae bacterium]